MDLTLDDDNNTVLMRGLASPPKGSLKPDVQSSELSACWKPESHDPAKYIADLSTGRAACKEFRCGQTIPKGKLRLGIFYGERSTDYFHPACLFKTFNYKNRANKRITSVDEISFDRCGNEADELRAKVEELLDDEELFGRNRKAEDGDGQGGGGNSSPAKSPAGSRSQQYGPHLQIRDDVVDSEDEEWSLESEVCVGRANMFDSEFLKPRYCVRAEPLK